MYGTQGVAMSAAEAGGWALDRGALSTYLGLASIVTWLGAQSPQIYENFKRGSVEGLALPFLISWFVGDFTNFLGCVLTHQLPFQTYLAGYFLLVDVVLCSQFAYYSRIHPVPPIPPFAEDFPYAQAHTPHHHHHYPHRHSGTRSQSRKPRRSTSRLARSRSAPEDGGEENPMAASWLTEGSGHSSDVTTSPRFSAQRTTSSSLDEDVISPVSSVPPSPVHQPERGRTLHRSAIRTFDPTLAPICGSPSSQGAFMPSYQALNGNHVSFSRDPEQIPVPFPPHPHPHPHPAEHATTSVAAPAPPPPPPPLRTTSSQSRPPVSRRSTSSSIMFLSVGALMTLGSMGTSAVNAAPSDVERSNIFPLDVPEQANDRQFSSIPPPSRSDQTGLDSAGLRTSGSEEPSHQPHGPDWERIWQNFRRRSVEGLAMTLFLFAFIGNSLYVASILANPQSSSFSFLLESLPYLLGSGGTLCFDLMILGQSWLYSEKRRARRAHERRKRAYRGIDAEEEAALLHADENAEEDDDPTSPVTSRVGRFSRDGRRIRKTSTGSSYRSATRSRSTSTLGYARSVSAGGGGSSRPVSTTGRSNSTEMGDTLRTPSASRDGRRALSRVERGILSDDPFDWEAAAAATRTGASSSSPYHSRRPSIEISDAIPEEGESGLTIRGG
ncbi:hypothetical protein B0A53_01449 [Rhodotorula sp. CCFEE 5036]|nr:hypothetical protein B0A53_01449 [Rhodotorula sp. CCFEE 5036]